MAINEINNLMLVSIQIIGIFIAIIGGLVASKLLSMKADKDELIDKIDILEKKIKHNTKILQDGINRNYEIYKENEYDLIVDAVIGLTDDYNPFEYEDPYIDDDKRKKFLDEVCEIITKISNEKYNGMNSVDIAKDLGYSKRTLEYKIIDYYVENKDYN